MKNMKKLLCALLLCLSMSTLAGCACAREEVNNADETPGTTNTTDETQKHEDELVQDTTDHPVTDNQGTDTTTHPIEDAGNAVGDAVDDAGNVIDDIADGAGNVVDDIATGAGDAIKDMTDGSNTASDTTNITDATHTENHTDNRGDVNP